MVKLPQRMLRGATQRKYGQSTVFVVWLIFVAVWCKCMTLTSGTGGETIGEHTIPVTVNHNVYVGCSDSSTAQGNEHFLTQCSKRNPPSPSGGGSAGEQTKSLEAITTTSHVDSDATQDMTTELNSDANTIENVILTATPSPPAKVHSGCSIKVAPYNASVAVRCTCERHFPNVQGVIVKFRADYEVAPQSRSCLATCVSSQFSLHHRCSRGESLVAATTEAFRACCLHACYGSWDPTLDRCDSKRS